MFAIVHLPWGGSGHMPSAFAEEDVFGFDIEMEYLLGMNMPHAAADIPSSLCPRISKGLVHRILARGINSEYRNLEAL